MGWARCEQVLGTQEQRHFGVAVVAEEAVTARARRSHVKKQRWSWYLACETCLGDLDSLYIRFDVSSVAEDIPGGLRRFALVQLCISNRPRGLHIEANDQRSPDYQTRTVVRPHTLMGLVVTRCSRKQG